MSCRLGDRILRLPYLRHRCGAGVSHRVLPTPGSHGGRRGLDGDICCGVPIPAVRRGRLWILWRPPRPQEDPGRHTVDHGPGNRDCRAGSNDSGHRRRGPTDPDDHAAAARVRGRRRVGRFGAAERRVRARQQTWLVRDVHRCGWRHRAGTDQPDLSGRELHHWRKQPHIHAVGVAHTVSGQCGADRRRPIRAVQHRRDPGVRPGKGRRKNPFGPSRNADCPSTAAAAARDSLGRRQRRLLLRLRLPGQHLLGQLRSNPTGVFARQHPVRQCAGWTAVHRVHRACFLPLFATNSGAAASYWPGGRWLYPGRCWSCR